MGAFTTEGLARLDEVVSGDVASGEASAAAWAVARRGEVHVGAAGAASRDTIFRISSMTKPITAVGALLLVEDGAIGLDDAVDRWLPEMADRRVMRDPSGSLDDTVPAERPITVRRPPHLPPRHRAWTSTARRRSRCSRRAPARSRRRPARTRTVPPPPDEWIRRLGTLPLEFQPGERWLYHVGSDVLGVLIARVAGQPLGVLPPRRLFEPLGMVDTGFWVPESKLGRFGACWGEGGVYDPPDGQWSHPPPFPSGGGGLVSTAGDYLTFGSMLLAEGRHGDTEILSPATVAQMTTDHLTAAQRAAGPDPAGTGGWGFGVGTHNERVEGFPWSPGSYTWAGGLGSTWANDPTEDLVGVLLTDRMQTSPQPPPIYNHFWAAAYEALA